MQQPPPRKMTKSTGGALKNVYTEQLNKLQQRHQQESDLLDDLRLFAKQRSVIEKEYAQALCKLAQQFHSKRPFPVPPGGGGPAEDGKEYKQAAGRTMHEVWQTVLEETDRVGKVRLLAADTYLLQISEPCKPVRAAKSQIAKKVFDHLNEIQKEVSLSVQDVSKMQKIYKDDEHVTHDARLKAAEADDKVKRKSVTLFTSLAKLQQQSAKLNTRRETCEVKSTAARNDYLLSLAAANAHVQRYFSNDTPELMKTLDGDVYERMQEYFTVFSQAELHSCGITQECFLKILSDATKINRPYNLQRFLCENNIFTEVVKYEFQPQENDPVTKVSQEHQSTQALEAEAKKCASRFIREEHHINTLQRKLQQLVEQQKVVLNASKTTDVAQEGAAGNPSQVSAVDIEVKMEDLRQALRKAQTERTKAEARLELLQEGGLNVDEFINAANSEVFTPEEEEPPTPVSATVPPLVSRDSVATINRASLAKSDSSAGMPQRMTDSTRSMSEAEELVLRNSTGSATSPATTGSVGGAASVPNGSTYINYQDDDEVIDEAFEANVARVGGQSSAYEAPASSSGNGTGGAAAVVRCVALYSFEGTNSDELDIQENESLEVAGDNEGDGWIKVRNASGAVGLVPESYVELRDGPSSETALPSPPPPPVVHVERDITMADAWGPPTLDAVEPIPVDHRNSTAYSDADADFEVQATLSSPAVPTDGGIWARALYDYFATSDEEITFMEGSLIRIVSRQPHEGVDDGWWEGEFNGKIGAFPSLVVEELAEEEDLASPQRPGPPDFPPPPPTGNTDNSAASADVAAPFLGITLPTPNDEEGGGLPAMESLHAVVNGSKDDKLSNGHDTLLNGGEDDHLEEQLSNCSGSTIVKKTLCENGVISAM